MDTTPTKQYTKTTTKNTTYSSYPTKKQATQQKDKLKRKHKEKKTKIKKRRILHTQHNQRQRKSLLHLPRKPNTTRTTNYIPENTITE